MEIWSQDKEEILENIRQNSILLSEHHKKRYYYYKGYLKYFRIPNIILSALNSVFSVGLTPYVENQNTISMITCLVSLTIGIISSLELYLSIQNNMERELLASKDFYLLGIDIYKVLKLNRENRMVNPNIFMDDKYKIYCKLIENSNIINKHIKDQLAPIDDKILSSLNSVSSVGSDSPCKKSDSSLEIITDPSLNV